MIQTNMPNYKFHIPLNTHNQWRKGSYSDCTISVGLAHNSEHQYSSINNISMVSKWLISCRNQSPKKASQHLNRMQSMMSSLII